LRKRIELDPNDPKIIHTVHGVGYRFEKAPFDNGDFRSNISVS